MDASMWVAKTGLDAQQTRMNVISNNLANVNTTGFKRDRAVFEDLLYQNIRQAGGQTSASTQAPTGLMLGTGVRVMATEKLNIQGNMINTQNPLDIPDGVLSQLGNRIQHALRAYTPRDQKAVKVAAETFRANPDIDVETAITQLKVGEALVSLLPPSPALRPTEQRAILYHMGPEAWRDLVQVAWARSDAAFGDAEWKTLLELPERWPIPVLPVSGRDLLAAGMSPGPEIGVILGKLEDWWVASDFQPSRDELLKRLT